jgi:hypothetical protein
MCGVNGRRSELLAQLKDKKPQPRNAKKIQDFPEIPDAQ